MLIPRRGEALTPKGASPAPYPLRSARIDFLRGVAIFAVLILHFSLTYGLVKSPLAQLIPASWIRAAVNNGNYGVTIFFVISGFLITSNNLLRYGSLANVNLRQFYAFRFSRIIPPLLLALAIIVPLGLLDVPSFMNARAGQPMPAGFFAIAVLSVLTFWHNLLMQAMGYFNYCLNIYWSLSVEEVFYLTFPLACVLLKRDRYIVALCVAAIIVGPIYRSLHTDNEIFFMYAYPACFDAIAFGCLAALLQHRFTVGARLGKMIRWVSGAGLAICYFSGIEGHEVFGFTFIALFTVGLLTNASHRAASAPAPAPASLWSRVVGWYGRHSYELYLFHIILLAGTRDLLPKGSLADAWKLPLFAGFLALSGLLAAGVARYFADPLNARLRRSLAAGAENMT